jgi:hypothetical protein
MCVIALAFDVATLAMRSGGRKDAEHDPEKWEPVFGEDHAQTESHSQRCAGPCGGAGLRLSCISAPGHVRQMN